MQNISNAAMLAEPSLLDVTSEAAQSRPFAIDTMFVLFFLALDFGQAWLSLGLDGVLAAITMGMFIALPYFLPFSGEKPKFSEWLLGRILVAFAGVSFGLMLKMSVGVLLPDLIRFVPMTLLIVAAIICCNVRIYDILKNRLAR